MTRRERNRPAESRRQPPPSFGKDATTFAPRPRALNRPLPSPFRQSRRCRSLADPIGVAACLANGDLDLLDKRRRARVDARAPASRPPSLDTEIVAVIACHKGRIDSRFSIRKMSQTPIVVQRKNTCCGVEWAECTFQRCQSLSFVIKWIADGAALAAPLRVPR